MRRRVGGGGGSGAAPLPRASRATFVATLATAPLIAHVFEEFSVTGLVANVLALPAVAPAMWLGMASATLAKLPASPWRP